MARGDAWIAAILLAAGQGADAQDGIEALEVVVERVCDCAAGQRTGLNAALACSAGLDEFGRLKVEHRDRWGDTQRTRAADLERVIESCITGAMTASDARDLLGIRAPASAGMTALVRWRRVPPDTLADHSTRLVRIQQHTGSTAKGLVVGISNGTVRLRRARNDGGAVDHISLADIRGAWVMELP